MQCSCFYNQHLPHHALLPHKQYQLLHYTMGWLIAVQNCSASCAPIASIDCVLLCPAATF